MPSQTRSDSEDRKAARKTRKRALKKEQKEQKKLQKAEDRELRARKRTRRASSKKETGDPKRRKRTARGRILRKLLGVVFITLLIGLCALGVYAVRSLPVGAITVSGDAPYSEGLVLDTCGLQEGQPLLLLRPRHMERVLMSRMPWLEKAEIRRSLPDHVEVKLTRALPSYLVQSKTGEEYLVRMDGKVLGHLEEDASGKSYPLVLARFEDPIEVGKRVVFQLDSDRSIFEDVFSSLSENQLLEGARVVNLQNPSEITISWGGRFVIELGDSLLIGDKLQLVAESIKRLDENAVGTLDATSAGQVVHRPSGRRSTEAIPEPV